MTVRGLSLFHEGKVSPEAGACSTALTPRVRLCGHLGPLGHVCELGVGRVQSNQNSYWFSAAKNTGHAAGLVSEICFRCNTIHLMQVEVGRILNGGSDPVCTHTFVNLFEIRV